MGMSFSVNLLPEVLIVGYQYPLFFLRFAYECVVIKTACLLVYGENLMVL
jgi:hypothetical protein